jgi:PAS domain S-box-containing protein
MEYLIKEKDINSRVKLTINLCLLLIFIIVLSYMGLQYYRPFHIIVEIFSSFIAFSIFIVAINSCEISKNIPFLFLGMAFGVAGAFNVIHAIVSNGMGFFQGDTTNLALIFSFISRFIIAISTLSCSVLFYKPYKIITAFFIVFGFSILSIALYMTVFIWRIFPDCYVPGDGITTFKILGEYSIVLITIICLVNLFKMKKCLESNTFLLLQFYFYGTIVSSILFNFYVEQQEITNVLAHILKLILAYCLYRVIVKVGLKTPYKLLFNEISDKNKSLKLKEFELNQTISQLKKENQLRKNIEELLLKNDACYKLLIEKSQDTIVIYTSERIIFANEGAASLVGIDKVEKLLEKKVTDFFPLNLEQLALQINKNKCSEQELTLAYETKITDINGKVTYVEVTSTYVVYNNERAVISIIRDISKDKQIEKLEKDIEIDKKLLKDTVEVIFDTNVEEKIIACDPDNIERIMMNLLSNAVKFTNSGDKITVEVMDLGECIEISVKDTGVGIPKNKLQVIFERFRQVDNSLSRSHEGSGIGLSLVKALVDMHGGSIQVDSSLGQGTEFVVMLPVKKINDSNEVEQTITYEDKTERIGIEFSDIYR